MFGRRKRADAESADSQATAEPADDGDEGGGFAAGRGSTNGPWDVAEIDLEAADGPLRVDLGSLLVPGLEGLELRLQADQETGVVTAAMLAGPDGAVELRVFAAPKSGGLWAELRREIGAEATRLGGTVDEREGLHGPELRLRIPVKGEDGRPGVQVSRVQAVEGPRWLLRATYLGDAVDRTDPDAPLERALREVVVVRGSEPMSPRHPLPLRLPAEARPAADGAPASDDAAGSRGEEPLGSAG